MSTTSSTRTLILESDIFVRDAFESRNDPLTLEPFKIGDTVRVCVKCNAAFLDDSWQSTGSICGCFGTGEKIDLRRRPTPNTGQTTEESKSWMWVVYLIALVGFLIYIYS